LKARALTLRIASLLLSSLLPFAIAHAEESYREIASADSKERSRLEDLFIWKVSEELKLQPAEEVKFTETIRALNIDKKKAAEQLDDASRGLSQASSKASAEKALVRYRKTLGAYQSVQLKELDRLKTLLGSERLARYIVVKNEITEKLKVLLSSGPTPQPSPESSATPTPAAPPALTPAMSSPTKSK
jgi:hypothetical protein